MARVGPSTGWRADRRNRTQSGDASGGGLDQAKCGASVEAARGFRLGVADYGRPRQSDPFAGIAPGDSAQTVDKLYLRPKQTTDNTQVHGGSGIPGLSVSYEGGVVKGVGAFAHELT